MILMWARACRWNSALLMTDAISWSIVLGSRTLSSFLRIRRLPAKLEPVVGAGAGLARFFWFHGGTVCHRPVGVGAHVVSVFDADVAHLVGVDAGLAAGAGLGLGDVFGSGFAIGIDLSCLPGCSCGRSSGFSGPPVCVRSACIEPTRPTPSVSTFPSSLWSCSVAATALATMSLMPLPHSRSSWWYASRIFSFTSNHNVIHRHCAVCVSSMFAIFAMIWCSCASWRACC